MEPLGKYRSGSNPFSRDESKGHGEIEEIPSEPIQVLDELAKCGRGLEQVSFFTCNPTELGPVKSEYEQMLRERYKEEGAELGIYLNDLCDERLELLENLNQPKNDLAWLCPDFIEDRHDWRTCPNCIRAYHEYLEPSGDNFEDEGIEEQDGIYERSNYSYRSRRFSQEESTDFDDQES